MKKFKFVVVPGDGEDGEEEEDGWYESEYATVFRVEDTGHKTAIGWIGGEPEDNNYYRTYGWIESALNNAYDLGFLEGVKRGLEE